VSDDGVAFVSFMDWVYLTLNLATRTQSGWITQFVDGPTSGDTSIDLDVEGNAHIIYHDSVEGLIKYAYQDNSGWKTDVIDQVGEYYPETSIALDQTDKPNISYSKDDGLYYAYLKDGAWNLELVDSYADRNSITLDNAGKPHISYTAVNHLMHAYLGTPPCTTPLCTFEYWGYGRLRDTVPYSLQVINTSSLTETFDISTEGYQWPISAPSTIGPLTFGESTSLHVQVTIPPTATLGSSDTATITLTSQNDPSVTTTATLTTYAAITTYLPRVSK
jgi:hypothetical protein